VGRSTRGRTRNDIAVARRHVNALPASDPSNYETPPSSFSRSGS